MSSRTESGGRTRQGCFVTTHWSVVLSAQGQEAEDAGEALETLCRSYWYPLYAYARRIGRSPADAEDLTQGFFARLLERDYLKTAAREKGRFRTFLLTGVVYVRRDGQRASRGRMLWRSLVAWSPVWPALFASAYFMQKSLTWEGVVLYAALGGLVALSLWLPGRGVADRLAGTWPVPR